MVRSLQPRHEAVTKTQGPCNQPQALLATVEDPKVAPHVLQTVPGHPFSHPPLQPGSWLPFAFA